MIDYSELVSILSVPRPNGSAAVEQTKLALQAWLERRGIRYRFHSFRLYPFFFECVGAWIVLSRTALVLAVWLRWGWPALAIALGGLIGGTFDVRFNLPVISWPGARRGENILIEFEPSGEAKREVVLSAHYDSKTELLDHIARTFFVLRLRLGIALTLVLGVLGLADGLLRTSALAWSDLAFWIGVVLTLPMLFLAYGLGLDLALGRLVKPSQGAVDNGAACAILLGLAERLSQTPLQNTRVTLALFAGEEVNMQGSRAYARSRGWLLPTVALNLEAMAQDGGYVYWKQDGTAFGLVPTSHDINQAISAAVQGVTGQPAQPAGPINSDGFSFLSAGIPTSTLGTFDSRLWFSGFHRPADNVNRVVMARLPEGVEILSRFVEQYDRPRQARLLSASTSE